MWRVLVPLVGITAIFVRLRLRRPPATPASDARQRRPPATPAVAMTWLESNGFAWVGLLGPVNNHGTPRPYLLGRETPPFGAKQAIWKLWPPAAISEPRVGLPKKNPIAVFNETELRAVLFLSVPTGAKPGKNKPTSGALPVTSRQLNLEHRVRFFAMKQATEGFKFNFQPG